MVLTGGRLFLALLLVDPALRIAPLVAAQTTTSGTEDKVALLEAKAAADTSACACTSFNNQCQTDACPLDSWTPDTDPCGEGYDDQYGGWVGVICDVEGDSGRVVGVLLYDTGVGGELLPFFGRLGAMKYLRLYANPALSGDVADLTGATELRELRLHNCPLVVGEAAALAALVNLGDSMLFPGCSSVCAGRVFLAGTGVRGPVAALRELDGIAATWGPADASWYKGVDYTPCSAFGGQQASSANNNIWGTGSPGCGDEGLAPVEDATNFAGNDECACCVDSPTCPAPAPAPAPTPTCSAMNNAAIQAAGYAVAGAADATTTDGLGAVSCHTTHVAEDALGAATTPSVSCDGTDFAWTGCTPKGSCNTDTISCPNSNRLVNYNTANGADEASCCEAVAGKCGGNTDSTTDYTCPTGYDPKANPSSIDSASTDADDARTTACCDAQTCANDVCTTGYAAKTDQTLAAGTAATLENCCDATATITKCTGNTDSSADFTCPTGYDAKDDAANTDSASTDDDATRTAACCDAQVCASDVCGEGFTAKTDQTLAAGTPATQANCCDADAPASSPPADSASTSGAGAVAVIVSALLSVALAHVY